MRFYVHLLAFLAFLTGIQSPVFSQENLLFFNRENSKWNSAIPIGNGRMGAMVFGTVKDELLQLNDDTFWTGKPRLLQKNSLKGYLATIRNNIVDGKTNEAQQLINNHLLGPVNHTYMPLADIAMHFSATGMIKNYRKELDLTRSVVSICYLQNDIHYKREYFASYPDQAIIMRLTANKKAALSVNLELKSAVHFETKIEGESIVIDGRAPALAYPHYLGNHVPVYRENEGMRFRGELIVKKCDGKITQNGKMLTITDASEIVLAFIDATSFNGFDKDPYLDGKDEKVLCENYKKQIENKDFETLLSTHVADYSTLYNRVKIAIPTDEKSYLPIDDRIKNYSAGNDNGLPILYFCYGRYLLISASRPGSQPSNLQGIWNNSLNPGWSSNWTINCNTQINYWAVETANLSECHLPLIQLIKESTVDGARTAQALYSSKGWVAHHNIDIWRTTWPIENNGLWGIFQVGGAWLCQHIWEHYLFTQDKAFLKDNYEVLKGAAQFYIDNLQPYKGYLVTNPSVSFENTYKKPDGTTGWACLGCTQDMEIIRALFKNTLKAMEILNETDMKQELEDTYAKLPPLKISPRTGALQEWFDDWSASSPNNGQVGHGWAVSCSDLITLRGTPKLAQAFRKTMEIRKPHLSWNSGSWTGAFPAMFWARLEEGDKSIAVVDRHLTNALTPNLNCVFQGFWEIDGNLGMTAAFAEMFLQSHAGEIRLLPALPSRYNTGNIEGLRARGGFEVDLSWKYGTVEYAKIQSLQGQRCVVGYNNIQNAEVKDELGNVISFEVINDNQIAFNTIKGKSYTVSVLKKLMNSEITCRYNKNDGEYVDGKVISLKKKRES